MIARRQRFRVSGLNSFSLSDIGDVQPVSLAQEEGGILHRLSQLMPAVSMMESSSLES
jgi:hypothetical protein